MIAEAYGVISQYALANAYYREAALQGARDHWLCRWLSKSLAEELAQKKLDQEKINKTH